MTKHFVFGLKLPAFLLAALLAISGCSPDGPTRYHVSGEVTYQGRPVPVGSVMFEPDTMKGNSGPAGTAPIKDGRYDTSSGGVGVVGGPHLVRISGRDGIADEELPEGRLLFSAYETTVDLPEGDSVQDFEVPAEGARGVDGSSRLPPP